MMFLIMQSSPASRHFFPLTYKSLPNTPFSNSLNQCPSLSVRDVSRPYKTAGKIVPVLN